jgi:protein-tyrosine-phosphatase
MVTPKVVTPPKAIMTQKGPVLFLCDRNTVRSPMAQGLLPGSSSAGLDADSYIDPFACAVMSEDGIDISGHEPKTVNFRALKKDMLVVALSLPAFEAARKWREKAGFELDYWDLPAVPSPDGGREAILDGYRSIRQALKAHIANRFGKGV